MRIPLMKFGGDERPMRPWEQLLAPMILVLVLGVAILMAAAGVALFIGWAVLSPVLPRSWRVNWDTAFDLDPTVRAQCPTCSTALALGPVDKQGQILITSQGERIATPAQSATCPQCQRAFRRFSKGKVWSSWREASVAEHT